MKNLILVLTLLPTLLFGQATPRAGGINYGQNTVIYTVHDNYVGVQHSNSSALAVYDFGTSFNHHLGLKTTDNIAEGSTNKFFSNTLARNAFSNGFGLDYSAGVYSLNSTTQGILSSVGNKFNIPTGTTSEYIAGDGSLISFPSIPNNTNQLTNGAGFLTSETDPVWITDSVLYLRKSIAVNLYQPKGTYLISSDTTGKWKPIGWNPDLSNYYTKVEVDSLIPTKLSELDNDEDFISEEVDPTVPSWAKTSNKPEYEWDEIEDKPTTFTPSSHTHPISQIINLQDSLSIKANKSQISSVGFTGEYDDLLNKPDLFDGDYNSLSNKPTIPTSTSQLINDSGFLSSVPAQSWSSITGKPTTLSGYGITDAYPLSGNPSGFLTGISSGQVTTALGYTPYNGATNINGYITSSSLTWSNITGKPSFATVATTGSYNDLSNRPSIPAAQVNSDWNSVSGVSQILNKPTLFSGSYNDLSNKPTIPTNTNQLTNGSGFISNLSGFTTSDLTEGSRLYFTNARARGAISLTTTGVSGNATYNPTTGELNIPNYTYTAKRQETYVGTTNSSGEYTVTFGTSYAQVPNIQAQFIGGTANQMILISSVSTTGFTVKVVQRNAVTILGIEVLLAATTNVNNANVNVLITEK